MTDDLYALAPEEFTRARDEQVKAARVVKDRARATELAALRRPTVSAYAVNALVRAEPALLDQLVELGRALAQAQSGGDAAQLRALGEQRRALVEAVADRAADAAGRELGAGPRGEVVATLEAALADPDSGDAVRSGRLVRPLSYAGFGGVDLEGAVAAAACPVAPPRQADRQDKDRQDKDRQDKDRQDKERQDRERQDKERKQAAARQAALDAAGALDDAVQAAELAESDRAAQQEESKRAAQHVQEAEQALAQARTTRDETEHALRRASRELDRAHDAVTAAQRAAEKARAVVERLDAG